MRVFFITTVALFLMGCISAPTIDARNNKKHVQPNNQSNAQASALLLPLIEKKWSHGSVNCKSNTVPAIDIFSYNASSYILRQNKCLSFEAPFIYLLFGNETLLVLDTGATADALDFPLYQTIQSINQKVSEQDGNPIRKILVVHSHSHADHYSGDLQFAEKPDVTLVEPNQQAVRNYFKFNLWPNGETKINLGERKITIIPTPGHQEEAITIYDNQTKWLLTGDSFYPGVLFVKQWNDFKQSITRLVTFSKSHEVSAVLGAHIEMTNKPGEYYPIGTIFQPNEASLVLSLEELKALNIELKKSDKASQIIFNHFIVEPMNIVQKTMSNLARWMTQ